MFRGFVSRRGKWAAIIAAAALIAGCGKKDDAIAEAEKHDVANGISAPSIAETKAIAEEGFIYGLPIVMNYAVMSEYAVDRDSGQFKAPFNQIFNEACVFTYKDTAIVTPNSDTVMRLYWPKTQPPSILPPGEGSWKPRRLLRGAKRRWRPFTRRTAHRILAGRRRRQTGGNGQTALGI